MRWVWLVIAILFVLQTSHATSKSVANIDHVILGVADLNQAMDTFEKLTGVRPAYGGKHPTGTHNALVSLGDKTYLEIIAVQPGSPAPSHLPDLSNMKALTPIGWAVTSSNPTNTRERLRLAGFGLRDWSPGSRVTPAGSALSWKTFTFDEPFEEAPFFIQWDTQSPHPATTSPTGCVLIQWVITGPNGEKLERLRSAFEVEFAIRYSESISFLLELNCPKGNIVFPVTSSN
jgi:hypothetical protein